MPPNDGFLARHAPQDWARLERYTASSVHPSWSPSAFDEIWNRPKTVSFVSAWIIGDQEDLRKSWPQIQDSLDQRPTLERQQPLGHAAQAVAAASSDDRQRHILASVLCFCFHSGLRISRR